MSVDHNVYVGPYVAATHRTDTKEAEVYGCASPDCPEYARRSVHANRHPPRFCQACGVAYGPSLQTLPIHRGLHDVLPLQRLRSASDGDAPGQRFYAVPNGFRGAAPAHLDALRRRAGAEAHVDLTLVDREEDLRWFHATYAAELEAMRAAYDDVDVRWGYHEWYS